MQTRQKALRKVLCHIFATRSCTSCCSFIVRQGLTCVPRISGSPLAGTTGCFDQQSNTHTNVRGKCHQTRDAKHKMSLFGQIELPSHNFLLVLELRRFYLLPIYYDDVTSYAGRARTRACAHHMHSNYWSCSQISISTLV